MKGKYSIINKPNKEGSLNCGAILVIIKAYSFLLLCSLLNLLKLMCRISFSHNASLNSGFQLIDFINISKAIV